jgi:hypothetical protein
VKMMEIYMWWISPVMFLLFYILNGKVFLINILIHLWCRKSRLISDDLTHIYLKVMGRSSKEKG